jgi:hypothetical protein
MMATAVGQESTKSYDAFDAEDYIKRVFGTGTALTPRSKFLLKHLETFFSSSNTRSLKVLDYGCGPSLAYSISAVPKASEIVLADYSKPNKDYLQKWLDGDTFNTFDWTPLFQYVVQTLEGGSEEDVKQRQLDLRRKVTAVVHCDILQDEFIDAQYRCCYDVVVCFLCLDSAVKDKDSYTSGMAKLSSLVREGGHLLLCSTRRENSSEGFYTIGGIKYHNIALKRNFVVDTLRSNGFAIETEDFLPVMVPPTLDPNIADVGFQGFMFFHCIKNLL